MISHEHRCIFIHIPRTAGSSIEEWLIGDDWWNIDPQSKHLTAHQARRAYEEFWDDYFVFSFVRHPYSRMASCLQFADHFGIKRVGRDIRFEGYEKRFGHPVAVEFDHRFYRLDQVSRDDVHRPGAIYGNILDEELDFIGRFENLDDDLAVVAEKLGVEKPFESRLEQRLPARRIDDDQIGEATLEWMNRSFAEDFERFDYQPKPVA